MSALPPVTKARYLLSSFWKTIQRRGLECPSCGGRTATAIDRKFGVTALRRCHDCRLLFRTPTTTEAENERFYQSAYRQGGTTEMPDDEQLRVLKESRFRGTSQDASSYLEVLTALGLAPGARILDFGCSWGYGAWQLQQAGYEVDGFEISRPRCDYARDKLGLPAVSDLGLLKGPYDCIFSAHVVEHVPCIRDFLKLALGLLRDNGLFVAFTPNGDHVFRQASPVVWHRFWGLVHPQLWDAEFCRAELAGYPTLLASTPYPLDEIAAWPQARPLELRMEGCELLIAFRKATAALLP